MTGKQAGKPLSSQAIEMMKSTDKNQVDISNNRSLRVTCGVMVIDTFFHRYTSPAINQLSQVKTRSTPQTLFVMVWMRLQGLKEEKK